MTEAVLVACVGSTLFMVGLTWFVQVVHYPLFSRVDPDSFPAYHEEHSARTTWVVAAPMLIELASSVALEPKGQLMQSAKALPAPALYRPAGQNWQRRLAGDSLAGR